MEGGKIVSATPSSAQHVVHPDLPLANFGFCDERKLKLRTQVWTANVAFLQLLLLADNLGHWFKRLCLPPAQRGTIVETLRHELWALPGDRICRSGKNVLVRPRRYDHQNEFLRAAAKAATLQPLKLGY